MNIPLPPRRRTVAEDMLPLINIVFLLILFFLMSGHLSVAPSVTVTPAPQRVSGGGDRSGAAAVPSLRIAADGKLRWLGETVDLPELTARAIGWQAKHRGQSLLVSADAGAPADRVIEVFERLRGAGVDQARLLTQAASH